MGIEQYKGCILEKLLAKFSESPETYFINWNATGFFKKDEKSYHFIYGYNFKDYIPSFNAAVKYVYGENFETTDGKKNHESESNIILNYAFQRLCCTNRRKVELF